MSSVDVVPYEFLEYIGYGCIEHYLIDECIYVYCIEGLREVYGDESCSVRWSFLVEAVDDWIENGVEGSGCGVF